MFNSTVRNTKKDSIKEFAEWDWRWNEFKKVGYTVRKLVIEVLP